MKTKLSIFFLLVCLVTGCDRLAVIRGKVLDVHGDALPGVAVTVRGADYDALTNGLGQYSLRCRPGTLTLDLMKTGYTPGVLQVEAKDHIIIDVNEAMLWPLPGRKGVYLFEDFRYQEMSRTEPKRYASETGQPLLAVKKDPSLETQKTIGGDRTPGAPIILCFKQPDYDIALCRMKQVEAALPQQAPAPGAVSEAAPPLPKEKAWVVWETVEMLVIPVDEVTRQLLEVRPMLPLAPGVYALHWGAMEGHSSTDPHVFLFRVAEPPAPAPAAAPETGASAKDTAQKEAPPKENRPKEAAPKAEKAAKPKAKAVRK